MSEEPKKTRRGQFVRRRPLAPDAMAYRVPQVAESLGVSESKVWKLIAQGEMQARKIGRATVIRAEDLKAYLAGIPVRDAAAKPATEGQGAPSG